MERQLLLLLLTVFLAVTVAPNAKADSLVKLKLAGFSSWDEPMEVPFSSWDEPMEVPLTSTRSNIFMTRLELKHKIASLVGRSKLSRRKKRPQRKLPDGKVKIECSRCKNKMLQSLSRKTAELVNCAYYCQALTNVAQKGLDIRLQTHKFCAKCNKKGRRSIFIRYRFAGQKSHKTVRVDQDVLRALVFIVHGKGNSVPKGLFRKVKTIFKL